jgi:hypothetical protein
LTKQILPNTFLLIKGGIQGKASHSLDYYDVSFSIDSQTGYIAKKMEGYWRLYLSHANISKKHLDKSKNGKYYFHSSSFDECRAKAEEILERISVLINRDKICSMS